MADRTEKNALFPTGRDPKQDALQLANSSDSMIRVFSGDSENTGSPLIFDVAGEYGMILESMQNNVFTFASYTKEKHDFFSVPSTNFSFFSQAPLHKHNFSEIGLVLEGIVYQNVDGHHLTHRAGQGFILNRNISHNEEFVDDFTILYLELPEDALSHIIRRDQSRCSAYPFSDEMNHFFLPAESAPSSGRMLLTFSPVDSPASPCETVRSLLDQLRREMSERKPGFSDLCDGLVLRLLYMLDDENLYQKEYYSSGIKTPEQAFNTLTDYLIENCGRFSRKGLEEDLHYSSGYLNKVCKTFTGKSLVKYGQFFSMKEAERLLLKTDLSITEIVERLGYTNRHYFNQVFESYFSVPPSRHRENHTRR